MIDKVEELQARLWSQLETYMAEFESIQRDIPPAPYGNEERALAYEKLRLRYKGMMVLSNLIKAYIELINMEREERAALKRERCFDARNKREAQASERNARLNPHATPWQTDGE